MEFPKAMFRAPGTEMVDGIGFTSRLVNDKDEQASAQADGWHETTGAAHDAHMAAEAKLAEAKKNAGTGDDNRPPTREELEAKAKELGIEFKAQTSNKKLAADIEAKLAEAQQ